MTGWLWALRALFAMEAASFALLIPRIPDIRDAVGLDPSELGLALMGLPIGTLAGFLVAPRVVRGLGSARAAWTSVAALYLTFVLVGLAGDLPQLLGALALAGILLANTEIALNAQANALEAQSGRGVISGGHGFWSLGSICGVLIGGLSAQFEVPVTIHATASATIFVPCAIIAGRSLRHARRVSPPRAAALPPLSLLPICLLPVGILAIEGVFMDWSAVFMTDTLKVDPFAASLGYLSFSVAMAGARLSGDGITARIGPSAHAVASGVIAAAGALLFAAAPHLPAALLGAFLAGAGAGALYPIALSLAARHEGKVIDLDHFATAYHNRMKCDDELNPFVSDYWRGIDTTQAMERYIEDCKGAAKRECRK